MKIIFKSSKDDHVISEVEVGEIDAAMPVAGDEVRWQVDGTLYCGRVNSRLINYSAPNTASLERSLDIDITAVLNVELDQEKPAAVDERQRRKSA
jgi:hypothetical protein